MRVVGHRNKVQDLIVTDKHLEGKVKPCDNASRHGVHIEGHDEEEKERQKIDNGKDIQVRRVDITDQDSGIDIGDSPHSDTHHGTGKLARDLAGRLTKNITGNLAKDLNRAFVKTLAGELAKGRARNHTGKCAKDPVKIRGQDGQQLLLPSGRSQTGGGPRH